MTSLTHWLSPSMLHALGWTLLHFLWQGTAIAALAGVSMSLCRRASARYVMAVGALNLMLAASIATFVFLTSSFSAPAVSTAPATDKQVRAAGVVARSSPETSRFFRSRDAVALPWLVEAWLLGVACFSLRSAGGFVVLERERRKQSIAVSDRVLGLCRTLQGRLGLERAIRYCECQ